jgi:hypothetical protein
MTMDEALALWRKAADASDAMWQELVQAQTPSAERIGPCDQAAAAILRDDLADRDRTIAE